MNKSLCQISNKNEGSPEPEFDFIPKLNDENGEDNDDKLGMDYNKDMEEKYSFNEEIASERKINALQLSEEG